jgi:hypothetical protein
VPRVELPDELFVNIAVAIGAQVNKFLCFLQDVSCERNLKHFVVVTETFLGLSIQKDMIHTFMTLLNAIYKHSYYVGLS